MNLSELLEKMQIPHDKEMDKGKPADGFIELKHPLIKLWDGLVLTHDEETKMHVENVALLRILKNHPNSNFKTFYQSAISDYGFENDSKEYHFSSLARFALMGAVEVNGSKRQWPDGSYYLGNLIRAKEQDTALLNLNEEGLRNIEVLNVQPKDQKNLQAFRTFFPFEKK